ncbi:hypothetical protein [Aeromonas hydrophila]|uniref:hypothetical protein n=1 Tax=Aeromonas hydrophila TaxID=644 RepID=UPI000332AF75|nr:hypothetical protein [Aeromonas hydrophila]AGM44363.1 hypothetical protein AHML_12955 [Aeromonas hydrophila ML09-119]AHX33032.1 hypothetical protein V428_13390 [Aeromonas hydrophila subsp. hydrophila AL09-71]AHX69831.1 hypothetical protein V429_13410 [Aeromonas hydrophila pc104A]AJE38604.1 hypothetical protein V469_09700 [Aeromonas hydrophila J-1]AKJ37031.1 hypothetical protein U876_10075 [Aeromonas hydrophila NJ-35]
MAQLNIRIADADKQAAEEVARSAGFSLGEYLGTVVAYMSFHGTLPVVIKFKPVAIKPDEAFQQAIVKFRNAYMEVNHLYDQVLKEGEMTPLKLLRQPIDSIDAAEDFYKTYESQIALAPGQLEALAISSTEQHMFARCREHFPYIPGHLRTAIRMVNMNNRPVNSQDLSEMREALQRAADQINILQEMTKGEISVGARSAFFIRDVQDATSCAFMATRPGEAYMVCTAWSERMNMHVHQAEIQFQSLGVVDDLKQLEIIWTKLRALAQAVHDYLDRTSEPMGGFEVRYIEELKEQTLAYVQRISPPEKHVGPDAR